MSTDVTLLSSSLKLLSFLQAQKRTNHITVKSSLDAIHPHEIKATKTMLLVIVCYFISWTPLTIKCLIDIANHNDDTKEVNQRLVENFCLCAVHFSSAVEATIFAYRIKDVRTTILALLRCNFSFQETAELNVNADVNAKCEYRANNNSIELKE